MTANDDFKYLALANELRTKEKTAAPGAALLVKGTEVLASSVDRRDSAGDPIAYAPMACLSDAGRRSDQQELTLYCTEPLNALSAGTVVQFGVGRVVVDQNGFDADARGTITHRSQVASASLLAINNVAVSVFDLNDTSTSASDQDVQFLQAAYQQAADSYEQGGIPVGAAIVENGKLVAEGHNRRVQHNDSISHGETDCLRQLGLRDDYSATTLYTTLSPCMMCTGAILHFGIPRVVIGESENFDGNANLLRANGIDVSILNDRRCTSLMRRFIVERPDIWFEDIAEEHHDHDHDHG